jgi:hypothetical protein
MYNDAIMVYPVVAKVELYQTFVLEEELNDNHSSFCLDA